jgi:hypothetical protein
VTRFVPGAGAERGMVGGTCRRGAAGERASVRDVGAGPSFERYVSGLPGGLGAHPTAQAKGSVVRGLLEELTPELVRALPAALHPLALAPPLDSDWIPETHFCALVHAIAERRRLGGSELLAWFRARNRALFSSPLYRLLMEVATPEAMLRHAGKRWGIFHRGSTLELDGYADDGVRVTLKFPPGLFDATMLGVFGEAFAAALEAARAKGPVVKVEASGPSFARYLARW